MLIDLICHNKSQLDLLLYTRNFENEHLKHFFLVQNHLLNMCSRAVNLQMLLCSQKTGVKSLY